MEARNRTYWVIPLKQTDVALLYHKVMGLTFVERRLREAKIWGIRHVTFVCPRDWVTRFPFVNAHRCAPWSRVETRADVTTPPDQTVEVAFGALFRNQQVDWVVESVEDFPRARQWFEQQILNQPTLGWFARHFNKPVSLPISRVLCQTSMTPNQMSLVNLVIGLLSAFLVAQDSLVSVVFAGILFQLASVFDGIDGEIAKFRLESSRFGAWLDTFVDNTTLVAFLTGAAWNVFRHDTSHAQSTLLFIVFTIVGVLGLLGCIGYVMHRYFRAGSLLAYDQFVQKCPTKDWLVRAAWRLRYLIKKDVFSLLFFTLCLLGRVHLIFYIAGVVAMGGFLCTLYLNVRYTSLLKQRA